MSALAAARAEGKRHGEEIVYKRGQDGRGRWWVRCDCGWRGTGPLDPGAAFAEWAHAFDAWTKHREHMVRAAIESALRRG